MTSRNSAHRSLNSAAPSRRTVVKAAAATAALAPLAAAPLAHAADGPAFHHSVASGDPLPDGVLLWTRVTPTPEASPGSGKGPDTEVRWEIATDKGFAHVVGRGSTTARAATDHTVKADVRGLSSATTYYFRFSVGDSAGDGTPVHSPVGRTRTTPAHEAASPGVRFGVVSCANWEAGYFSAYRHLAARTELDAVLHLGDYIYEYPSGEYPAAQYGVRQHEPRHEIISLATTASGTAHTRPTRTRRRCTPRIP